MRDWPAFADSPEALQRLKHHVKLAVITNCDDDLFAASNTKLGVEFDWVITAEQARGYKPRRENFEFAFARIGSRASASCTSRRSGVSRSCEGEQLVEADRPQRARRASSTTTFPPRRWG